VRPESWLCPHRVLIISVVSVVAAVSGDDQVEVQLRNPKRLATAQAASQFRDGEYLSVEDVSKYATPALAYIVRIERAKANVRPYAFVPVRVPGHAAPRASGEPLRLGSFSPGAAIYNLPVYASPFWLRKSIYWSTLARICQRPRCPPFAWQRTRAGRTRVMRWSVGSPQRLMIFLVAQRWEPAHRGALRSSSPFGLTSSLWPCGAMSTRGSTS
jgi:hypothetical protein